MARQDDRYSEGLQVRREVLGSEYVDRALTEADEFTRDLQAFVIENCWGTVWVRPGLDRRTRSLVTLTALVATGKWTELKTHVRGAVRNGCTSEEIKELFLHLAVYLGVPAAVEAFRVAQSVVAGDG